MFATAAFARTCFTDWNVISIQLPPLRDRREDIPLLIGRFLEQFCRENQRPVRHFTHGAMKLLIDYDWLGNVRELLENTVERAVVLSDAGNDGYRPPSRKYSYARSCEGPRTASVGIFALCAVVKSVRVSPALSVTV